MSPAARSSRSSSISSTGSASGFRYLHRDRMFSDGDDATRSLDDNMFTLDDGRQKVTLISDKRNELGATYIEYLSKNMGLSPILVLLQSCSRFVWHVLGGSETFQEKKEFFLQKLCRHHSKRSRHSKSIEVKRQSLLADVSYICGFY